jgi:hypothetical protein
MPESGVSGEKERVIGLNPQVEGRADRVAEVHISTALQLAQGRTPEALGNLEENPCTLRADLPLSLAESAGAGLKRDHPR